MARKLADEIVISAAPDVVSTRPEERTYEIITRDGTLRIRIPESWKVTYGPVSPGAKGGYGNDSNALRIWENSDRQRAIFLNVSSFRDLSIPVERLFVRTEGSQNWEQDSEGNSTRKSKTRVESQWRMDE